MSATERVPYEQAVGRKLVNSDKEITSVISLRLTPGWTAFVLGRFGVSVLPTSGDRQVQVSAL